MSQVVSAVEAAPVVDPRRDVILSHARRMFLAQGYYASRMEQVARASSVSTATLYAFFPSKDVLFSAVIEDAAVEFGCDMDLALLESGPVCARLAAFAEAYARFMVDPFVHNILRLVLSERQRFEEMADRFFLRGRELFGGRLIDIVVEGVREGDLVCERPSRAAGQFLGMIEHPAFTLPMMSGRPSRLDPAEIATETVSTFMARYGASHH